jgi:hypothetical protein
VKVDFISGADLNRMSGWKSRVEIRATPRDNALILEPKPRAAEGDFQTSGVFIVADEQIRHAQTKGIERSSYRHSDFAISGPAAILNGGKKTGANDFNVHGDFDIPRV